MHLMFVNYQNITKYTSMLSWQKEGKSKSRPSFQQWLASSGTWQGKPLLHHLLRAQIFPLWQHWHSCTQYCLHTGLPAREKRKEPFLMVPPSHQRHHSVCRVEKDKSNQDKIWNFHLYLLTGLKGFQRSPSTLLHREGLREKEACE